VLDSRPQVVTPAISPSKLRYQIDISEQRFDLLLLQAFTADLLSRSLEQDKVFASAMKLDTRAIRYLTSEDWRVLTAVSRRSDGKAVIRLTLIKLHTG